MKSPTFISIGFGTMGSAIVNQIVKAKQLHAQNILVIERSIERRRDIRRLYTTQAELDPQSLKRAKIILLAVKPQDAKSVLLELQGNLNKNTLVISIMAGVSRAYLTKQLRHQKIIRVMPNLAATKGRSISAWTASANCSAKERAGAEKLLRSFGTTVHVANDTEIDRITAVIGSGPGYFYAFANDLVQASQALGYDKKTAIWLVRETLLGAAALYQDASDEPLALVQKVASKKGTTEEALKIMQRAKSTAAWTKALQAAFKRAQNIAKDFDKK